MKTTYTAAIVIAIASLAAGQAMADTTDPITGMTHSELSAAVEAAKSGVHTKTSAQVRAEAVAAQRSLDARDTKDPITGMSHRQLSAAIDAAQSGVYTKTRAQVRAEVVAAQRSLDARDTKDSITGMSYREMFGG